MVSYTNFLEPHLPDYLYQLSKGSKVRGEANFNKKATQKIREITGH